MDEGRLIYEDTVSRLNYLLIERNREVHRLAVWCELGITRV